MGKGSDFERSLCKKFSLWWTNNERDDVFWRTSQSGGRATERKKKGKMTAGSYGDMMSVSKVGKPFEDIFVMEFKKGYTKELSILSIVDGKKKSVLLDWWIKNEKIVSESGRKFGLIVFRRDYRHTCIVMNLELFNLLIYYCKEPQGIDLIDVYFTGIGGRLIIMQLDFFLNWCSPETLLLLEGL